MPTVQSLEVIKLTDLYAAGKVLTDISPDALIYVVQGNDSFVIKWQTIVSILTPAPPTIQASPLTVTVSGTTTKTVNANTMIDLIRVESLATGNVKIGITPGGGEILDEDVTNGDKINFDLVYFIESGPLYFTASNSEIKVYVR